MRKVALLAVLALGLPALAHAGPTDTFSVTTSFRDAGNDNASDGTLQTNNDITFSAIFASDTPFTASTPDANGNNKATATFTGGVGDKVSDGLTITAHDASNVSGLQYDDVAVKAVFTLPNPATGTLNGDGDVSTQPVTQYDLQGVASYSDTDGGFITWDNKGIVEVAFKDGSLLDVSIDPVVSLVADNTTAGASTAVGHATLTMTVVKVPEPGTLAILGVGLIGLGLVAGSRRRSGLAGSA